MFRWCSYCQHLIGESKPLHDYRITHGICDACAGRLEKQHDVVVGPQTLRAKEIFLLLEAAGHSGDFRSCTSAIDDALGAGLLPSEVIVGVAHPALIRIGELWETNSITVADEHRFTRFVYRLHQQLQVPSPQGDDPVVLLAPLGKNCHELGLLLLQHLAHEQGIACTRLPAGTPGEGIVEAVVQCKPAMVGLSVSLVEAIPEALRFARYLTKHLPAGTELVLGGQAFRSQNAPIVPDNITILLTTSDYVERIKSLKRGHRGHNERQRKHLP